MSQNLYTKDFAKVDWGARFSVMAKNLSKPVLELYDGMRTGTIPWGNCFLAAVILQTLVLFHIDYRLALSTRFGWLYPVHRTAFYIYYAIVITLPFTLWALGKSMEKERLVRKLTNAFKAIGLKNNLGKFPNFVFDRPIDASTRKLKLTRATLSVDAFQKAKASLESALQIYIDEIKENRVQGTLDIIYAHHPMPDEFRIRDLAHVPKLNFIIGTTRSQELPANLNQVPHLLIAGQTGGGKSTFLRQLITALFLNNKGTQFTLIDLKGGLEFQTFENLPRVKVVGSVEQAVSKLEEVQQTIQDRMALLKANKCKDILEYAKIPDDQRKDAEGVSKATVLNRHLIVVDEAAEMFLAGNHAAAKDIQAGKKILSQVARQGRSLGVHLVIATQRPDSRALDPQIKANLTGVLCFQMVNDISSITVLGTGRATDLPPIPGRAIWKSGMDTVEVQTPFLTIPDAEELLSPHRIAEVGEEAHTVAKNELPEIVMSPVSLRHQPLGTNHEEVGS